jgi:methylglutaconyl-CoA hydratase
MKTVFVGDEGSVRTITLNRPERRNAMTPLMQTELVQALQAANDADGCRVVVLRGAGETFCSGLDLTYLQEMEAKSAADHRQDAERIALLFETLYTLQKPTIAVVHGAAIAGGTGLATICDLTLAATGTKFGYTEVRIGFVPALVSAYLTLQVGDKRARDLLITGRLFDADEAQRLGIVNEVMAVQDLAGRAAELAKMLASNSSESMRATKALLAQQNKVWLDKAVSLAMETNADARTTKDFHEGVAAFLEKRKPKWAQ